MNEFAPANRGLIVSIDDKKYNRRQVLSAACATALVAGCNSKVDRQETSAPQPESTDPLRILWVGQQSDTDAVTRAWGSVAEQPLEIELIKLDRSQPNGLLDQIVSRAKRRDVVVYPICAAAELGFANLLTPLTAKESDAAEEDMGRLYPVMRKGAARFGGESVATPIGVQLPALLCVDEVETQMDTWSDYHDWVVNDLNGAASEPISKGWAGMSFLWRASSSVSKGWLFGREGLKPLIDGDEFVATLEQMQQTVKQYKNDMRSPEQIWTGLATGDLRGAIGFQVRSDESSAGINVSHCPGGASGKVLLDPFTLVASISVGCRQSAASKRWINWLSGGEGVESVRRQIDSMSITRTQAENGGIEFQQSGDSSYERWLRERLGATIHLPTLQLLQSDHYYDVLDQQVASCLDGTSKPSEALKSVASSWKELTKKAGVEKQRRAWRRSQGLEG